MYTHPLQLHSIKIGDVGIARRFSSHTAFTTSKIGTPEYEAPEMLLGQPYNYPFDIWSLGCIVYELCTLKHPFHSPNGWGATSVNIMYHPFTPITPTGPDDPLNGLSSTINYYVFYSSVFSPYRSLPYYLRHAQQGTSAAPINRRYSFHPQCCQTRSVFRYPSRPANTCLSHSTCNHRSSEILPSFFLIHITPSRQSTPLYYRSNSFNTLMRRQL